MVERRRLSAFRDGTQDGSGDRDRADPRSSLSFPSTLLVSSSSNPSTAGLERETPDGKRRGKRFLPLAMKRGEERGREEKKSARGEERKISPSSCYARARAGEQGGEETSRERPWK